MNQSIEKEAQIYLKSDNKKTIGKNDVLKRSYQVSFKLHIC